MLVKVSHFTGSYLHDAHIHDVLIDTSIAFSYNEICSNKNQIIWHFGDGFR